MVQISNAEHVMLHCIIASLLPLFSWVIGERMHFSFSEEWVKAFVWPRS